jgi:hypothetical protein
MRHLYILILLLCLFNIPALQAQPPVAELQEGTAENLVHPSYPGGSGAFQNYVMGHVKELNFYTSQRVYVHFVVEKDGSLSNIPFQRERLKK